MLGKLLKYEMKSSARTLLPLYIGTLVAAVICGVQMAMMLGSVNGDDIWFHVGAYRGNGLFSMFLFLLFLALCVAIMVLTAMIVIQRFNKNLIGDEGYLMFTLPVTHVQILSSKLIAGLLWVLIGTVIMSLSGLFIGLPSLLLNLSQADWAQLWTEILYTMDYWDELLPFVFSTLLNGLFSIVGFILIVYLSIMVGQMEQFNKHRVAVSVVLFFLINWVFSLVETTIFRALGLDLFQSLDLAGMQAYNWMMWGDIAFTAVQCVLCFAGIIWLMKKKLNL